jgi:competence protein ComEA
MVQQSLSRFDGSVAVEPTTEQIQQPPLSEAHEGQPDLASGNSPPVRLNVERPAARGLMMLAGGAAIGATVVVLVGWPRGEAVTGGADPPIIVATSSAPSAGVVPSSTSESSAVVVVDVAGSVRRPGVVELPTGSRVIDALKAAGGVRGKGDTTALNLAKVLVDGEQILVGSSRQQPLASTAPSATSDLVDINTATLEQLDTLPGIGPVLAQAIIDWRTQNGSFTSIEQLQEVSGIGDATFADLQALVRV